MENKTNSKFGIILSIIVVVLLLGGIGSIFNNCSGSSSSSSETYHDDRKSDAWVCAQKAVKDKLKSPSTAKFPIYQSGYVTSLGDSQYKIKAYVDSQNGFGSMIRTNFVVTLTLTVSGFKDVSVLFD